MTTQTDTNQTAANEVATESKKKTVTVADNFPARSIFESTDAATEFLTASATRYEDWNDQNFVTVGLGEEGFDSEVYTSDMDVMVAKLTRKDEGVKAIVIAPVPKIDAILASDSGRDWLTKIIHKELNHVAVRNLRDAEDVQAVADQIPSTLAAYTESGRASAGILESFNELYKSISATLAAKIPVWAKYNLRKNELRKALESKGYAMEIYRPLEDFKGKSLFDLAIEMGIAAAKAKGLDSAIFERWKETRHTKTYDADAADDESLDLDNLMGDMLSDPVDASTEATTA